MTTHVRITAKYRSEPDYSRLARALLSIVDRLDAEEPKEIQTANTKPVSSPRAARLSNPEEVKP
jgi:hypothetical protein